MMRKSKLAVTLALASAIACPIALVGCGNDHTHTFDTTQWVASEDGTGHYNPATCEHTDAKGNFEGHDYSGDDDTTCNLCDYVRTLGNTDIDENVGTISGIVTAYGAGLSGVKVSAGGKDTATDAYGHFSLGNVEITDSINVTFTKDKYNTETRTVTKDEWEDGAVALGTVDLTLIKEVATIGGTVKVPANGSVITLGGATVTLCDQEGTPLAGYDAVTTEKNGAFSFDEVPVPSETKLCLKVTHPYCVDKTTALTIKVGTPTVTQDVTLMSHTVDELGNKSICDLISVFESDATPAVDYDFRPTDKGGNGQGDWLVNTSSYNMSSEGLLLHQAGQDIAAGTAVIKLYAYKKLSFTDIEQVTLRVRRFSDSSHNAELMGGGHPEMYIVLVKEDGTVITPKEGPGEVTSTSDTCNEIVFTFDEPLNGEYIFAVGETRGNRSAVESIAFRGAEVTGTVSGAVYLSGNPLGGAEVKLGATTVTTGSDGAFSIEATLRKGDTAEISIRHNDDIMYVKFTAADIEDGAHSFGNVSFKPLPLPGIKQETLDAMTAVTANNVVCTDKNQRKEATKAEFQNWIQVGRDNGDSNEGWLLRDAGYAELGTTELKVFMYNKLRFTGVKTIVVRARTFTDQNNVDDEHRNVHPEMILKIIDGDGNSVKINNNVSLVDTDSDDAYFYFTLDNALTGDYVLAIGMARGQRLDIGGIEYLGAAAVVQKTITGTIKDEGVAVSGATVGYSLGYNIKGTVTTDANGTFSINVLMRDAVTLNIAAGDKSKRYRVNASAISGEIHEAGDIQLSVTYLSGLTSDDVDEANVCDKETLTFTHQKDGGDIKQYWNKYGDVDWGHDEGACIQLNDNNPVSYIYAKLNLDAVHSVMKLNARMFLRGHTVGASDMEDQPTAIKVTVITASGTAVVITPTKAVRANTDVSSSKINGNGLLINDADDYTEGYYDLSEYLGQDIVVVIQAVYFDDRNGKQTHNAIQEISFGDYLTPPVEGGDPDTGSDD